MTGSNLNAMTPEQTAEPVTCTELQCLYRQLEKLATYHQAALREENVLEPVEKLLHWVEDCQDGSRIAERQLYTQGVTLLEQVSGKLKLALEEELRMTDESPTAATTTRGRTADRYAKANTRSTEALSTLHAIVETANA